MKASEYRKQCIAVLNAARQRWNELFKRKPPVAPLEDNLICMNFGPSRQERRGLKSLITRAKRKAVPKKYVAELEKRYIAQIPNEPHENEYRRSGKRAATWYARKESNAKHRKNKSIIRNLASVCRVVKRGSIIQPQVG